MASQGVVPAILPVHIVAGALALVFGYTALYAAKGARLHRRSGTLFAIAMLTMSLSGALVAALNTPSSPVSVVAGLTTFYMVTTGLLTVRRPARQIHWSDTAVMVLAIVVAVLCFGAGLRMLTSATRAPEIFPSFLFGVVGLLAAVGDARMIRAGGIQGTKRIVRHLWRMCFAMWIAAASFFWGPQRRVPEAIRIPALQAFAVLLPVGVMVYWLWRLRAKRASSDLVASAPLRVLQ